MTLTLGFAIISGVIYLSGFIPYIYHVFHGKVVPHAFSWSIWATLSVIWTIWIIESANSTALISPIIRTTCLIIGATIGWIYIKKISITWFDYISLMLAVWVIIIAFNFWVTKALIPMILIDFLVLTPTLKKIWVNPGSEDAIAWFTTTISQIFLIASIGTYTFESSIYWIYIMIINVFVWIFIILRFRYTQTWKYKFLSIYKKLIKKTPL